MTDEIEIKVKIPAYLVYHGMTDTLRILSRCNQDTADLAELLLKAFEDAVEREGHNKPLKRSEDNEKTHIL